MTSQGKARPPVAAAGNGPARRDAEGSREGMKDRDPRRDRPARSAYFLSGTVKWSRHTWISAMTCRRNGGEKSPSIRKSVSGVAT